MTAADIDRPAPGAHATLEERSELGRSIREHVPRSTIASWEATGERADPVDILERQATTREPSLVPLRYGRMLAASFAFYRGGVLVMAAVSARMRRRTSASASRRRSARHGPRTACVPWTSSPRSSTAN